MATLLARVTDFQPSTPILSAQVDSEFDQIVQILSGAVPGNNKKVLIKVSDAGDPPLELDQIGAGPIQEWYQNSILKASITNSGQFKSEIATGTAPLVIASTTLVTNLNADQVDGLHASSFVRKDDSSLQTIVSNLTLSKASPVLTLTDGVSSAIYELSSGAARIKDQSGDLLTFDVTTHVGTFAQIPVLPASDPTTANQATRKQYVDNQVAAPPGNVSVGGNLSVTGKATGLLRRLVSDTTSNSTSGTGEDDLTSFTIPAGTLPANGDYILFHCGGSMTDGGIGNTNTIRARIVGNQLFSVIYGENTSADWALEVKVVRLSDTSVRCVSRYSRTHTNYDDSGTSESTAQVTDVSVSSLSGSTNIFKVTGEVTNAADSITQKWLGGEYVQA